MDKFEVLFRISQGSSVGFSPDKLTIQRAHGYPAQQDDIGVHTTWLKNRYKELKATGSNPQELRENADKELASRAKMPEWLTSNYKMPVLNASKANSRLYDPHKIPKPARAGLKEFTAEELTLIEQALQPMSDAFIKRLRFVRLIRQKEILKPDGTPYPENEKAGAQTLYNGNKFSIRFFDLWRPDAKTFIGGIGGVHKGPVSTVIHESGHVIEQKMKLRQSFNSLVKKKNIKPYTDYAASKPDSELYAEALWIYELDPEWLQANYPSLYEWIDKRGGR